MLPKVGIPGVNYNLGLPETAMFRQGVDPDINLVLDLRTVAPLNWLDNVFAAGRVSHRGAWQSCPADSLNPSFLFVGFVCLVETGPHYEAQASLE